MKEFLEKIDMWASNSLNVNGIIQQAGRPDGIKVGKCHLPVCASSTFLEQGCLLLLPLPVDIRLHLFQPFHVDLMSSASDWDFVFDPFCYEASSPQTEQLPSGLPLQFAISHC